MRKLWKESGEVVVAMVVAILVGLATTLTYLTTPDPQSLMHPWCPTSKDAAESTTYRSSPNEVETPEKQTPVLFT